MRWTAKMVREVLGGTEGTEGTVGTEGIEGEFSGISTDTRHLTPDTLFVALQGDRFDAHDFLKDAAAGGATGAVVRRGTRAVAGLALFLVDDTLRALGQLARYRRDRITGPVVAVSGNNGKTTTKEMVAAVLRTRYRTHATRANLNNLVGVPLTILEAPDDVEVMVVEAGTNMPGETGRYREIIDPTISIVTNATAGHLEGFGTMATLVDETLRLVDRVPLAVIGPEPPELARMARARAGRTISVGWDGADRTVGVVTLDQLAQPTLVLDGQRVTIPLSGRHQALNARLAWCVVDELGLDHVAAAEALRHLTVPGGRSELKQAGRLTILNDCYNANPHSFLAAIESASSMRPGRRLVFVAGTMRELGEDAGRLHAEVAAALDRLDPDLLAVVGDFVPAMAPYAARFGDRLVMAPDAPALGPLLAARLHGDEVVVLKASRGVALERILPHLTAAANSPG